MTVRRVSGVQTDRGRIDADYVVLCGGMWTRDLAAGIGVTVPLHACEHYYVLFQDVPGLTPDMPVLRDYDHCSYFKYDAGKLLVGAFEPHARPWGADGIPEDFSFGEIAGDFATSNRCCSMPCGGFRRWKRPASRSSSAGRRASRRTCATTWANRPNWRTASSRRVSIPSVCNPPAVSARSYPNGSATDTRLSICGRSTCGAICRSRSIANICATRVSESLGLLYATHWPFRQYETARGVRKSALHDRLAAAGACFGEAFGWERANWYAPAGTSPRYEYSYGRQNWFDHSAKEHQAVRTAARAVRPIFVRQIPLEGRMRRGCSIGSAPTTSVSRRER